MYLICILIREFMAIEALPDGDLQPCCTRPQVASVFDRLKMMTGKYMIMMMSQSHIHPCHYISHLCCTFMLHIQTTT